MPNGGRIDFTVGLKTDKSSLNQLNKALQAVQDKLNLKQAKNGIKDNFQQAIKAAKELQGILNSSWNDKLDQLNLDKFNSSVVKTYGSVNNLRDKFVQSGEDGQSAFLKIATEVLNTNTQLKESSHLLDDMADTFGKTVRYGIASSVFNNIKNSLQQAFYFAKDLDLSLTDIRIVTGDSADQMERFARQANESAKSLGRSTLDYTKAALTFYQQGLSSDDVQARTQATMMAQNITGVGVQMADYLTAVWNGFQATAQDAITYVDKLAAVADSSASDMSQLAIAMSKVASTANNMGVDVDQLNAQIATVVATTRQAPESVGTAFKTIYARINDIKAGTDEAEVSLGNYSGKMAALGFNVFDTNGKLRDTGQVIEQIGGRWQSLSRQQQIYLAQTMAGQRQYNNLIALFDNWTQYSEMLNISLNAEGTLLEKNDRYLDSVKAHMQQLNAETERTYMILSDTGAINNLTDLLTGAVNIFNDFIEGLGGGITALSYFGSVLAGIFSKQIAQGIQGATVQLQQLFAPQKANKAKQAWLQATTIILNAASGGITNTQSEGYKAQIQAAKEFQQIAKGLTAEQEKQSIQLQIQIGKNAEIIAELEERQSWASNLTTEEQKIYDALNNNKFAVEDTLQAQKKRHSNLQTMIATFARIQAIQMDGVDDVQAQAAAIAVVNQNSKILQKTWTELTGSQQLARNLVNGLKNDIQNGTPVVQAWDFIIQDIKNTLELSQQDLVKIEQLHKKINTQVEKELENQRKKQESLNKSKQALIDQAQQNEKIQNLIKGLSSLGQVFSSVAGAAKVFGDENATAAEKANAAFSTLQGTISAVGTYFGPIGMAVATFANGFLSLMKQITPLGSILQNIFSSTQQKLEKISKIQQQIKESTRDYKKARSEIEGIREQYQRLSSKSGKFTDEEKQRYNEIAEIFQKYNQDVIIGYDAQGEAIIAKNGAIDDTLDRLDSQYYKILRNKAAQEDLDVLDLPFEQASKEIERLESSLSNVSQSANFQTIYGIIQQLKQGGHDKIAPLMEKTLTEAINNLSNAKSQKQKADILNNLYNEFTIETQSKSTGGGNLLNRLASFPGQEDVLTLQKNNILDYLRNVAEVPTLLERARQDFQEAAPIQVETFLNQLQVTDEYQQIRQSLGDDWETFGQDAIDTMIRSYGEGLKRTKKRRDIKSYIDNEGIDFLQQILDMLDPDILQNAIEEKQIKMKNAAEMSIKDINKALSDVAAKYLINSGTMDIWKNGTDDQKNLLHNILQSFFGIDFSEDGSYTSQLEKQVDQVVQNVTKTLNSRFDQPLVSEKQTGKFKSYLIDMTQQEFRDFSLALENIDLTGVQTFEDLIKAVEQFKEKSSLQEVILSWEDQLKLGDVLSKEKDISKVSGGLNYLKQLEKQNPKLLALATKEGGRYGQAYVKQYLRVIRQAKQKQLDKAKQDYEKLSKSLQGLTGEEEDYQEKQQQAADALQLVIELQTQLAQINKTEKEELKDSNEQLKTRLQLLKEEHDLQKTAVETSKSVYNKFSEGDSYNDLSDDEKYQIMSLQYKHPELKQFSSNRNSEQYLSLLKQIIQAEKQAEEASKQRLITRIDLEIDSLTILKGQIKNNEERVNELQQQIDDLQIQKMMLLEKAAQKTIEKYTTLQQFMEGFEGFKEKLRQDNMQEDDIAQLNEYLDALIQKYPEIENAAEMVRNTWLNGTKQYRDAILEVQDTLLKLNLKQAVDSAKDQFDDLSEFELKITLSTDQFDNWKQEVQDFFEKDRQVSIAFDDSLSDQFERIEQHMDIIYEAASKIGENFVVAGQDIALVTKVFPQIANGMQLLSDGSWQLNQDMVQNAMATASQEVRLSSQTVMQKLQAQADYHNYKAEQYERIAQLAHQLANNEIETTEGKNSALAELDGLITDLQQENDKLVEETNAEANKQIIQNESNTAQAGTGLFSNMGKAIVNTFHSMAQGAITNLIAISDTVKQVTNNQDVTSKTLATGDAVEKIDVTMSAAEIAKHHADQLFNKFGKDINSESSIIVGPVPGYTQEQLLQIEQQASARAQQERQLAQAAIAQIDRMQARQQQILNDLNNVAKGQGIKGKDPEKESKGSTPKQSTPKQETQKEPAKPDQMDLLQEQIDAYHDINIELQKIERSLKKVQQQQQKFTGKRLLNYMQKELDLLNKQIAAQKQKMSIAEGEALTLKANLQGQGVAFDSKGQIANYGEVLRTHENYVNELISYYNSLSKEEQQFVKDSVEQAKEDFEKFKKNIENYDQIINKTIPDLREDIRAEMQQQINIKISRFKMGIDLKLDAAKLSKDFQSFLKNTVYQIRDDDILGQNQYTFKSLKSAYFRKPEWNVITGLSNQINNTIEQIRSINKTGTSSQYGDNKTKALEDLQNYRVAAVDELNDINQMVDQIKQSLFDAIEQLKEGYQDRQKYYEHVSDILNHDAKMIDLIYGDKAYDKMNFIYTQQEKADRKHLADLAQEKQYWEGLLNNARQEQTLLQQGTNEWKEKQDEIKKYEQAWMESTQNMNTTLESAVSNIISKYENAVRKIFSKSQSELVGTAGYDLSDMAEQWQLLQKQADMYLDQVNRGFEIERLTQKFDQAIEDNKENVKAQRELTALKDHQLSTLKSMDKLTQYDVDRVTKQLDLEKQRLALQEVRNNKTKLRLRRDSQGNYSYQYTADQSDVGKKGQALLDSEQELYNFTKNQDFNRTSNYFSTIQDYYSKAQDIMIKYRNQEDLMYQHLQDLNARYLPIIQGYAQQEKLTRIQLAQETFAAITETGEYSYRDVFDPETGLISSYYQQNYQSTQDWMNDNYDLIKGKLQELSTGPYAENKQAFWKMMYEGDNSMNLTWQNGIQGMMDKITAQGGFQTVIEGLMGQIDQAMANYKEGLRLVQEYSGQKFGLIGQHVRKDVQLAWDLKAANDAIILSYKSIYQTVVDDWLPKIDEFLRRNKAVIEGLQEAAKAAYEFEQFENHKAINRANDYDLVNNYDPGDPFAPTVAAEPGTFYVPASEAPSGWFRSLSRYATGGYTGSWGSNGKLAVLDQKELVLNQTDTQNILNSVSMVRGISDMLDKINTLQTSNIIGGIQTGASTKLDQNVHITAQFPSVTNSREIELALESLTSRASQYIHSTWK